MPKYGVLLHVRQILLQEADEPPQLAGAYMSCCVEAADSESAGNTAVDVLKSHPKYLALAAWPPRSPPNHHPSVEVDSVDRLHWWSRIEPGINTGFIFYVDTELPENAKTARRQASASQGEA